MTVHDLSWTRRSTSWDEAFNDTSQAKQFNDTFWAELFNDTSWLVNSSGKYKRGVNKIAHYLSTTRNKNLQNKYTPLPAIFWAEPFKGGRYVLNFERPSVYDTGRPIPFFRKFRITCPPRSANLIAPRLSKKPWERISRKGARDRRNPTAGRENQQRRRTVHHQTSYCTGEILHSQQDLTTAVFLTSHFTFIQQVQIQCWITLTLDPLNLPRLER